MLGERSDQRGLWEGDRLYLDLVGRDTLHLGHLAASPPHRRELLYVGHLVQGPSPKLGTRPVGLRCPISHAEARSTRSRNSAPDPLEGRTATPARKLGHSGRVQQRISDYPRRSHHRRRTTAVADQRRRRSLPTTERPCSLPVPDAQNFAHRASRAAAGGSKGAISQPPAPTLSERPKRP